MIEVKAVIYDMDGLLIDSMMHWIEADRKYFANYGITLTNEMVTYFSGRSELENINYLKVNHGLVGEPEHLLKERNRDIDQIYLEKTKLMPGVVELLEKLKKAGLKQAVATGAPYRQLKLVVDRFKWQDHFEIFVAADQVNNVGKPDPGIFLHTAKELGVKPEDCVVFEDAENGVVAAKRAGMRCIAVPNPGWSFGDFSGADLIVNSLEDKRVLDFLALI